jgi:hypothetical protein
MTGLKEDLAILWLRELSTMQNPAKRTADLRVAFLHLKGARVMSESAVFVLR